MKQIYLDYNATTSIKPQVADVIIENIKEIFGNPSSIHQFGQRSRKFLDESREKVALLINCQPDEIVFTSCGTESNNAVLKSTFAYSQKSSFSIVTSAIEHQSVLNVCKYLEELGVKIIYLPVDEYGKIVIQSIEKSLDKNTKLVSIMLANNDVGTIQPITEIANILKSKKILFHSDAVQGLGKIQIDVKELNLDFMSLSAHKIYGPKGIGALYIKRGAKLSALIHGGSQERNRRAGTENLLGIIGFGKACEIAKEELVVSSNKAARLRDKLEAGILSKIENVTVNGDKNSRLPNTLNISFEGIEADSLLMNLDLMGIAVSSGSACSASSLKPSHVLLAMGRSSKDAFNAIRFSIGYDNTEEEIDYVLKILVDIVKKLREMSPVYK